jgi:predicted negative regulator of RcsB-dependent stress response
MRYTGCRTSPHMLLSGLMLLTACITGPAHAIPPEQQMRLATGAALFEHASDHTAQALATLSTPPPTATTALVRGNILHDYELTAAANAVYTAALSNAQADDVRQQLLLRLARVAFTEGDINETLSRLNAMSPGTGKLEDEKQYLLARIALSKKQIGAAADRAEKITRNSIWQAYLHYDLGIALAENWEIGRKWLDQINHMVRFALDNPEYLALADQANMALAQISLSKRDNTSAGHHIGRIRKNGPLSNAAMLTAGWTASRSGDQDQALAHWIMLRDRNQRDKASLEVMAAIPHAYEKLGKSEVAVINYELAAARYAELQKEIDNAVIEVSKDRLLDSLNANHIPVVGMAGFEHVQLPSDGLFAYLYDELSEPEFQRDLRRYKQLSEIRKLLLDWHRRLPVLQWSMQKQVDDIDAGYARLEQFGKNGLTGKYRHRLGALKQRLRTIESSRSARALANPDELRQLQMLERIGRTLQRQQSETGLTGYRERYRLLAGVLDYRLRTALPERLNMARQALDELDQMLARLNEHLAKLPQQMTQRQHDLQRLHKQGQSKHAFIDRHSETVQKLLRDQGRRINDHATAALSLRREHLDKLYLNARHSHVRVLDEILARQVTP